MLMLTPQHSTKLANLASLIAKTVTRKTLISFLSCICLYVELCCYAMLSGTNQEAKKGKNKKGIWEGVKITQSFEFIINIHIASISCQRNSFLYIRIITNVNPYKKITLKNNFYYNIKEDSIKPLTK